MGAGSNGQGSSGGNGGKGGNPQGNKPSGSGAQNTTTRKVSFYIDYNEEPASGETLRFIEKGFGVMPSPVRTVWWKQAKPHHYTRARRQAAQEKPGTVGPGRAIIKHLGSRRLRQVPAGESSAAVSIGY
jgi:hypothetical protein